MDIQEEQIELTVLILAFPKITFWVVNSKLQSHDCLMGWFHAELLERAVLAMQSA